MSLHVSSIKHELGIQDSRRREVAQNLPRPARIRMTVATQGVGETRMLGKNGISFGAFLLEEPSFSFGVLLDQAHAPKNGLPVATATVLRWHTNKQGLYIGADVGLTVFCPFISSSGVTGTTSPTDPTATMRLRFSLTFEANALRSTHGTGIAGAVQSADSSGPVHTGHG